MPLTASQLKAKERVESEGGTFVAPSKYRSKPSKRQSSVARRYVNKSMPNKLSALHPDTGKLFDQILDPEDCQDLTRWPNTYGLSGIYKCKNILNAKFSSDNKCSVAVYPRLSGAIFTTAGDTVTDDLPTANGVDQAIISNDFIQLKAGSAGKYVAPIMFPNSRAAMPTPTVGSTGKLFYPFSINPVVVSVTSLLRINALLDSAPAESITMKYITMDNSGNIVQTFSSTNNSNGLITLTVPSTGTLAYTHVAIEMTSIYDYSGEVDITFTSANGAELWTYTLFNQSQHMTVTDLKDASTFYDSAQKYIVLSQSLLCTAQMSTTKDGGSIATALLPGDTAVGQGDGTSESFNNWYEFISSLPNNSYDGAVKNGSYCWYLANSEAAYEYRDVKSGQDFHMPYMVSEFTVSDDSEDTSVRIKVNSIVQFTSTSSIFAMSPSDYMGDWRRAQYLLSIVPNAFDNRNHKKKLKAIAQHLLKTLAKPEFYQSAYNVGKSIAEYESDPKNILKELGMLASVVI